MRIYLDVCCLNRPFDDQQQIRIRLESEILLALIDKKTRGRKVFVCSDAVEVELANMIDLDRLRQIKALMEEIYSEHINYNSEIIERARCLLSIGLKNMDALHVACAEAAKVDIFLTMDDQLRKVAERNTSVIKVRVVNPVTWIREQGEENENC